VQSLPEVIVSATREPSSVFEAPYAVSLLESSELQERGVRSLPDALRYEPGVMVQKTSAGQGSPFVRGFTGFRTLALVDGVRLNNSTFREGPNQYWNTIDSYGLRSIELTRGQGGVLYGSDAIGGTMNAVPKGAPYFPGTAAQGKNAAIPAATASGGQLYSRYASGEDAILGRAEGWMSEDQKYGIFLGFTAKDFGDLRAADLGRLPKTGYEEWDMDARAEFWLEPDLKLTVAHQQVHQDDVWRTHRTIYGVPWGGTTVGNDKVHSFDQDRVLTYARLEGTP
jgi:hemoglobin/transferrin/lactoferrin receptor protein